MTCKRVRIIRGGAIWYNTNKPSSVWLEMGNKRADHFLALDLAGLAFLSLIPQPWGAIATTVASRNHRAIKKKKTKRGVWVKISQVQPFMEARKRTKKNMKKCPRPW